VTDKSQKRVSRQNVLIPARQFLKLLAEGYHVARALGEWNVGQEVVQARVGGARLFLPQGAEAFKRDIPNAVVRFFDTGHFALETHAAEIGAAVEDFLGRVVAR
jgi:hypothetical protein